MPTFRVHRLGTRVVIVHDMADQVVISELDWSQAAVLLGELQSSVAGALLAIVTQAGMPRHLH